MSDNKGGVKVLVDRLAEICAGYPVDQPQMVADVVRTVVAALSASPSVSEVAPPGKPLLTEVADLGRTIEAAKAEMAALRAKNAGQDNVAVASDELDAVVTHTADATNAILEACEMLDNAASSPGGPSAAIVGDATSRIYEACSFQDITGQRITKVVGTLKIVEAKVARIIETFGQNSWDAVAAPAVVIDGRSDAHLLNGPQMPAGGMGQTDIDALLSDF